MIYLHPCERRAAIGNGLRRVSSRGSTYPQGRYNVRGMRRFEEVLKVAIPGEYVVERLIHDIISGCVDEGSILVNHGGGYRIKPDRSTNLTALIDLDKWHT